jgi:hypothetical protein
MRSSPGSWLVYAAPLGALACLLAYSAVPRSQRPPLEPLSGPTGSAWVRNSRFRPSLSFEENRGQARTSARFLSRGRGYTLALSGEGASLSLSLEGSRQPASDARKRSTRARARGAAAKAPTTVRMRLVDSNPAAKVVGAEKQRGVVNYLLGRDRRRWRTHVPTYAKVKYEGVYPGVDLVFYGTEGQLEYDFLVAPGADPAPILLSASGAERVELAPNGDLLLHVPGGVLTQHKPFAYQLVDGEKRPVPAEFVLQSQPAAAVGSEPSAVDPRDEGSPSEDHRPKPALVSFRLARYDAALPLVIDPTLAFSTYLGGTDSETASAIAVDASGDVYAAGFTLSTDFPTAGGGYDETKTASDRDAYITKLSGDDNSMIYSTYLGGSDEEFCSAIAADATGRAYIAGETRSADFPTEAAYQAAPSSAQDAFVTRLSADGSSLGYSTYLGGTEYDAAAGIAVDSSGAAYVTGTSISANFPTQNPLLSYPGGSVQNGFLTKLAADGQSLVYSTYLGGTGDDSGTAVAVGAGGSVCVTGYTNSDDLVTVNASQAARAGAFDLFVQEFAPSGGSLLRSTYLGGSGYDLGYGAAVGSDGAIYVTGRTSSDNFPLVNPLFTQPGGSSASNAFAAKIRPDGALGYSTYLGGSDDDAGSGLAVDATGAAYVTGMTRSSDFPTANAIDSTLGGSADAFVTKIASSGASLVYSTYLGGSDSDQAVGIALNAEPRAFITGYSFTSAADFPLVNAIDSTAGSMEAFVASIEAPVDLLAPANLTAVENAGGQPVLTWDDNTTDETGFTVERQTTLAGGGFTTVLTTSPDEHTDEVDTTATPGVKYTYRARAERPAGSTAASDSVSFVPSAPLAPSGVALVVDPGGTPVRLTWSDNSFNEVQFLIERSPDGTSWSQIDTAAANATSADDPVTITVDSSEVYRYRIVAQNETASSAPTGVATTPYFFPTDLSVAESVSYRPVLSWTDRSPDETGFQVERLAALGGGSYAVVLTSAANENTNVEDTSATPGVQYYYRVSAVRPAGTTAPSNDALFLPSPPAAPAGLTAQRSAAGTSITLQWSDLSGNETGFYVERSTDGSGYTPIAASPADQVSFVDGSLDAEASYAYRISSFNELVASTTIEAAASPAAPGDLSAAARSATRISLSWTDNSFDEAGFEIQAKRGSGAYALVAVVGEDTRSYDDTELLPGTSYTYRVRSFCESTSGWTDPASATTVSDRPETPGSLSVHSPDRGHVELNWMDNSTGETGFQVFRRTGSSGAFSLLTTAAANVNAYTDATTSGDTKYGYTVAAVSDRGVSRATGEKSVTTMWGPEALTASAVTTAQVNLAWKDMTLYEDGYSIERRKGSGSFVEAARVTGKVGKNQTLTYSDTGVISGITYSYRIRAYNANAYSLYGNASTITTTGAPEPSLRVTPISTSYGRVPRGQARTATFTVRNTGKRRELVVVAELGGAFRVLGERRLSLQAAASRSFRVRFTAGKPGFSRVELPVRCQHGEVVTIKLNGRSVRR